MLLSICTQTVIFVTLVLAVVKSTTKPFQSDIETSDGKVLTSTNKNISTQKRQIRQDKVQEREDPLTEQEIISKVLDGYDWRVRPKGGNSKHKKAGGPVNVTVNTYVRSISNVDEVNMEYSTQLTFREQWIDPRLAYSHLGDYRRPPFVVLASDQRIWIPDTFFQNEQEARRHLIDTPNILIRIYPDGGILYSVRLSLTLSCPMSLQSFPFDHQTCHIDLASYAYTTVDIDYYWKSIHPVQFKAGLRKSLPGFDLHDIMTESCNSKTNTGEYSCLRIKLRLKREYGYYLLHLYIPSFMLVVASWVTFWLDKNSVTARVTLGMITLLTMTTLSSGINTTLPPVSYIKAIDVWIIACLAFIVSALLEFAAVNYVACKDMESSENGCNVENANNMAIDQLLYESEPKCHQHPTVGTYKDRSTRIDIVSRCLFPMAFLVFNCVYWIVYLM